ncbi:hypothetical protein [uncultured Jannaschia sp.]|uniref:hypothetical protein n=1 Tax=uncultured Jannaschia sp. TaxID=293347 RepID=UPI002627A0CF|nr:hypothetical protein [uncultured Jannaschia sp.]
MRSNCHPAARIGIQVEADEVGDLGASGQAVAEQPADAASDLDQAGEGLVRVDRGRPEIGQQGPVPRPEHRVDVAAMMDVVRVSGGRHPEIAERGLQGVVSTPDPDDSAGGDQPLEPDVTMPVRIDLESLDDAGKQPLQSLAGKRLRGANSIHLQRPPIPKEICKADGPIPGRAPGHTIRRRGGCQRNKCVHVGPIQSRSGIFPRLKSGNHGAATGPAYPLGAFDFSRFLAVAEGHGSRTTQLLCSSREIANFCFITALEGR